MSYFVLRAEGNLPVSGPFSNSFRAVAFLDTLPEPAGYYVASRYELSKQGLYPQRKAHEARLLDDLQRGAQTLPAELPPPLTSGQSWRLSREVVSPELEAERRQAAAAIVGMALTVRRSAPPTRAQEASQPGPELSTCVTRVHVHQPATHIMLQIAGGAWVELEAASLAQLNSGQRTWGLVPAELTSAELSHYAGYIDLWG